MLGLVAATASAATGVVVTGVGRVITTTVSHALLIETVQVTHADVGHGFRSDDRADFKAAAEINTGDWVHVNLALVNESDDNLVC